MQSINPDNKDQSFPYMGICMSVGLDGHFGVHRYLAIRSNK